MVRPSPDMTSDEHGAPDHAQVRVIPPIVPLGAIVLAALLGDYLPLGPGRAFGQPWMGRIGWAIALVPLVVLAGWAVILFLRSGQNPEPHRPSPSLVVKGPYRFTRNPMYLAMVLLCLGAGIARVNVWLVLLTPLVGLLLRKWAIEPEERYLEAKFGEAYRAYTARVRRWF